MKNVIITGSSRGIGFELVNLFNKNNYNVIALSRNASSISKLNLNNVSAFSTDLSDSSSINKAVKFNNSTSMKFNPFIGYGFNDLVRKYSKYAIVLTPQKWAEFESDFDSYIYCKSINVEHIDHISIYMNLKNGVVEIKGMKDIRIINKKYEENIFILFISGIVDCKSN